LYLQTTSIPWFVMQLDFMLIHLTEEKNHWKKVCFIHPRKRQDCGRGGAGSNTFVWALLDWRRERI
jgi:hypothetical protein